MKKTLIALAVAASAAVSGSAMAWTANGTGGTVDIGGTLTPQEQVTPWEIKVGEPVAGLNSNIKSGTTTVDIPLTKTIPVLGIRTQTNTSFNGANNITPQINYHDAINTSDFSNNSTILHLNVLNAETSDKIGEMRVSMSAGAVVNYLNQSGVTSQFAINAPNAGDAFFGGVPNHPNGVDINTVRPLLSELFSDITEHYNDQNIKKWDASWNAKFDNPTTTYSGYYASGIKSGQNLRLTLDSPAQSDTPVIWKASLPVTISYQ
ncbi:TPA: hypothetical protein ACIYX1_004631 [Escherichia coli]